VIDPDVNTKPSAPQDNTAARGKRLAAAFVDLMIMLFFMTPVVDMLGVVDLVEAQKEVPMDLVYKMVAFQLLWFFVLNSYFLYSYGQTIGKRIMGIAIVTMDDRVPAFGALILQRYITQWAAGLIPIPGLGMILRLADVLAIFRADKRCIHDLIAGTKVIDLRLPRSASEQARQGSLVV
jgi:uncharacterized RDD family membrane protein YckC